MQELKRPTIWQYLIWGLVFGFIASLLIVRVFGLEHYPVTKTMLFQHPITICPCHGVLYQTES